MRKLDFENLVALYRRLELERGPGYQHSLASKYELHISDQSTIDLLRFLLRDNYADDTGVTIARGDPENLKVGDLVYLRVNQPRPNIGLLAWEIESLIKAGVLQEPKNYYLVPGRFASGDSNPPQDIKSYRKIVELISVLAKVAAYLDQNNREFVFVDSGKYAVPIYYTIQDVRRVNVDDIDALISYFSDDTHLDQKRDIAASTIVEMTSGHKKEDRFSFLISNLSELLNKIKEGYRLFCSSFSYEEVKGKVQDAKLDFTKRIHDIFSNIQNQVLSIPVATVIVSTQMKASGAEGNQALINKGILVGCWFFAFVIIILLFNQWCSINAIRAEVVRQKERIKKDYPNIESIFKREYTYLLNRILIQKGILLTLGMLVLFGLVCAHFVYNSFLPDDFKVGAGSANYSLCHVVDVVKASVKHLFAPTT